MSRALDSWSLNATRFERATGIPARLMVEAGVVLLAAALLLESAWLLWSAGPDVVRLVLGWAGTTVGALGLLLVGLGAAQVAWRRRALRDARSQRSA